MAATLYKVIKVCTGEVIKHEVNGNEWLELRLWSDALNPVLYQQVKGNAMKAGDSMFTATLHDVPRKLRDQTVNPEEEVPVQETEGGGE